MIAPEIVFGGTHLGCFYRTLEGIDIKPHQNSQNYQENNFCSYTNKFSKNSQDFLQQNLLFLCLMEFRTEEARYKH